MKIKILLSLFISLIVIITNCNAQTQIPNGGFENWGCAIPPVTYNITQSYEDSMQHNYSIYLQYEDSLVVGSHKAYFLKFFSPNGDGWNDLCDVNGNPDSTVTNFNLTITDFCGDTLFQTDNMSGWDGAYMGNWESPKGIYKRSIYIQYSDEDTVQTNDSVQLIRYDETTCASYVQLYDWTSFESPHNYFCSEARDTSHYPFSVGNYSLRLENNADSGWVGAAITSSFNNSVIGPSFPVIGHPDSLTGYYKFAPQNGDTMNIVIILFKNGSVVSSGTFSTSVPTNWTSFNLPIPNYIVADSGEIIISACNISSFTVLPVPHGNSVLNIDNLNFDTLITSAACKDSANFELIADTLPHHYTVIDSSTGVGPLKYFWSWGDGTHDTIPYPSHTYADTGFYTICLTVSDSITGGCASTYCDSAFHAMRTTNTMVYVNVVAPIITVVSEVGVQTSSFSIYPNPATNQLTIRTSYSHANEEATVSIMNVLGGKMQEEKMKWGNESSISIKSIPAGIYFVQVASENGRWVGRFVKE